jgi:glycosyltransferase involved in cell wall biosynthesis
VRILFLNPIAQMGGAEHSLVDLIWSLRDDAQIGLLAFEDGPLVAACRDLDIPATIVKLPDALLRLGDWGGSSAPLDLFKHTVRHPLAAGRALRSFSTAIAAFKPSIVHSNGIKTHLLSGLVTGSGAKLVWHVRDFIGSRPVVRKVIRLVSGRVSTAVAISRAVEQDLRKVLPKVQIALVPDAVDLERFEPRPRQGSLLDSLAGIPPAAEGTVRIGLVATYAKWKGHRLFLEAAALAARQSRVPLRFYVIGGPIYLGAGAQITENDLRAWIWELGLSACVGIVPFTSRPQDVFNSLEIAVNANTSPEPFGRTVVEALASGVPVVAGPDIGALEGVPPGVVERLGVLSPESLGLALASLASRPDRRVQLSKLGPGAALRFSRQRLKERMLDLYARLERSGADE